MAKKILIVDDEPQLSMILRDRLEGLGNVVEECCNGSDALHAILTRNYDLVIANYTMPYLRGDELHDAVREHDFLRELPIIFVTGMKDINEQKFKIHGANDVVYKPFDQEQLFSVIQRHLRKSWKDQD